MTSGKYIFNSNELTYKRDRFSFKKFGRKTLLTIGIILIVSIVINLSLILIFGEPIEKIYTYKNEQVIQNCDALLSEIETLEASIIDLKQKDDNLYRPIFSLAPLPNSVREAGFGGREHKNDFDQVYGANSLVQIKQKLDVIGSQLYIQNKSFDNIYNLAKKKITYELSIPAILPLAPDSKYHISSYYGYRLNKFTRRYEAHYAIDYAARIGVPIYATGDGKVITRGYNRWGYGNEVVIDHGFGVQTRYAHLSKISVEHGQKITRGQLIGLMGNTGRSTGPHLHYEVIIDNKPVNPRFFYSDDLSAEEYQELIANANKDQSDNTN